MGFKILAINPGSTSTKVALYDEERPSLDLTLRHTAEQIARYTNIIDQLGWRREMILTALSEHGFDIMQLSAVIGRGGLVRPIPAGVYEVNEAMRRDLTNATMEHASNLGGLLAAEIAALNLTGVGAYDLYFGMFQFNLYGVFSVITVLLVILFGLDVGPMYKAEKLAIETGKTYSESDVLVLKQSASGKVKSPTPLHQYVADIYGNINSIGANAISLQDTIVRSRTRPTAYVVPADVEWIDKLLYTLDRHGAEDYKLNAGSSAELQQYYYIEADGTKSCIADLRDSAKVTFEKGAYVIPMDQESGTIIGMLMEPDVGDSARYNGTIYQNGLLKYDETTKNFPLYRYTGNDPRTTLVSNGTSAEPTQPTQPEKPSQPASSDTYTVVSGDSLWKIASKQLGNGNRWTEIYDLNKDTVKSPSVIFVGQILKMPLTAVSQ